MRKLYFLRVFFPRYQKSYCYDFPHFLITKIVTNTIKSYWLAGMLTPLSPTSTWISNLTFWDNSFFSDCTIYSLKMLKLLTVGGGTPPSHTLPPLGRFAPSLGRRKISLLAALWPWHLCINDNYLGCHRNLKVNVMSLILLMRNNAQVQAKAQSVVLVKTDFFFFFFYSLFTNRVLWNLF